MSSSTTADTSPAHPATDADARLAAGEWIRVALLATLVSAAVAVTFDLLVAERVIDRAIALEGPASATDPFTRSEQKGGLVLAELGLAAGIGLLLAGALTLLGARGGPPRRRWLLAVGGLAWGTLGVAAAVVPPLPPGAEAAQDVRSREAAWVLCIVTGVLGVVLAANAWSRFAARAPALRAATAAGVLLLPALPLLLIIPRPEVSGVPEDLLREFAAVSLARQALAWATLAAVGAWLLGRRQPPA